MKCISSHLSPSSWSQNTHTTHSEHTRMKKINTLLKKCKTLTRQLSRSTSYSSLRSKSTREDLWGGGEMIHSNMRDHHKDQECETIFVGSSRKPYVIASKHLSHPLLNALIEKSKQEKPGEDDDDHHHHIAVKCEVVLFDHLLWMLDNADPNLTSDSLEELAELYVF